MALRNTQVWLNGKKLKEEKATVSINNRSFRYGDGCFETMKMAQGRIALFPYHMERFFASLRTLHLQVPAWLTPEYILAQAASLAADNGHTKLARIRLTAFRGNGGLFDPENHQANILIQTWALNPENNRLNQNGLVLDIFRDGIKACDALANLKSNNYLLYAMAAYSAKEQRCNDALVLNQHGRMADSTIANLWIAEGNTILTPPLSEGPVAGTMRRFLLSQPEIGAYQFAEEPIAPERLIAADAVMLTNAVYGLKWVARVQEKDFPPAHAAAIFAELQTLLNR